MWWYITLLEGDIHIKRSTTQKEEAAVVEEKRRMNSVKRKRQNRIQRHFFFESLVGKGMGGGYVRRIRSWICGRETKSGAYRLIRCNTPLLVNSHEP